MKTIGFIGQGWIGKHYADDFEHRGFTVIRYAKEEPFACNKEKIATCDIVFIAVPTPTTPHGFNGTIVEAVLALVGKGNSAVIKSTVIPGFTLHMQQKYPDIFIFHAPEFLSESTAAFDASHPKRNIVGVPINNELYKTKAQEVLDVLPQAPFAKICTATEAELIKYSRNGLGYVRVVFMNMLYDIAEGTGADWNVIREAISADPDNGPTYTNPIHKSGRGAGGHCFIKDFRAFRTLYETIAHDPIGNNALKAFEEKNNDLLVQTGKDLQILEEVIGEDAVQRLNNH